ncbi:hypothetical protein NW768_008502 [Fusarium equiseti]|uniref:Uncharacterized protein n=1 Tax=Fusarium equiseti TaxID=61235 RepID=A0ABQ8R6X9_FUSEQ|nr:hypothetical protein NW768_008502 [Fusarium equiseti]
MGAFVPAGPKAKLAAKFFAIAVGDTADQAPPKMQSFLQTAITYFDLIKPDMNERLADELAHFVTMLSRTWKDDDLHLDDIRDNVLYREAGSLVTQDIPYPLWFVLACAFGAGHPKLAEIRDTLSTKWGCEIPLNTISYPFGNGSSREFELFGLGPEVKAPANPSTIHAASTSSNAAEDSATQATTNPVADTDLRLPKVLQHLLPSPHQHPSML